MSKTRNYKGYEIVDTASADAPGKVYIPAKHPSTGMPMDESLCQQFQTVAAAKEWIDDEVARAGASHS